MPEPHAIDVSWLRKTFDDDTVLTELYTMYISDATKRLEEIHQAVGAKDAQRCSRVAHTLKGSSGNVGAGQMRDLAARLEKHDWTADAAGAEALVGALDAEFMRVQAFVREFLAACPCAG
jgi:HPt (histidine-containing phosphotransfer) domain-containing protein